MPALIEHSKSLPRCCGQDMIEFYAPFVVRGVSDQKFSAWRYKCAKCGFEYTTEDYRKKF